MHVHLQSAALRLRRFTEADAGLIVELDADPLVRRHLHMAAAPTRGEVVAGPLARILAWHERSDELGFWWVEDQATGDPLGWVHLRPCAWAEDPLATGYDQPMEIGWRFFRRAWGRGAATAAMHLVCERAIDGLGIPAFTAVAMADNDPSFRVMERLGLRYAGQRRVGIGIPVVEYAADAKAVRAAMRGAPEAGPLSVRLTRTAGGTSGGTSEAAFELVAADRGSGAEAGRARFEPAAGRTVDGEPVIRVADVRVAESLRRRGVGARLVRAGLEAARGDGFAGAVAEGPPGFLGRFGFEAPRPDDADAVQPCRRALEGGSLPV